MAHTCLIDKHFKLIFRFRGMQMNANPPLKGFFSSPHQRVFCYKVQRVRIEIQSQPAILLILPTLIQPGHIFHERFGCFDKLIRHAAFVEAARQLIAYPRFFRGSEGCIEIPRSGADSLIIRCRRGPTADILDHAHHGSQVHFRLVHPPIDGESYILNPIPNFAIICQSTDEALLQMNIQLSQVLSDMTGKTGLSIIRALLAGERDPHKLATLRNYRCKKEEEEIAKALTGTWREEHLFILKQSLEMYDFYTRQIEACDEEIEEIYQQTRPTQGGDDLPPMPEHKRKTHSKNAPQNTTGIRRHLKRICGVDITAVHGISASLAQTIVLEVGTDMSKFPNEKHFCSWLGLAPKHEISGGKVLKNKTLKTKNRAGQAFRMAAGSVMRADCMFGAYYRRQKARLGPAQAAVATAHQIAKVVYRMLKYQVEYDPLSAHSYEAHYKDQLR